MAQKRKTRDQNLSVSVQVKSFDLFKANCGLDLTIRSKSGILGYLSAGRGGLYWTPKFGRQGTRIRKSWITFAKMMES